jgi:hypothetical protein
MTLPRPDQLDPVLDELATIADQIKTSYRWAYPMGWEPRRGETGGRSSSVADPTGTVAATHMRFRSSLAGCARAVSDANQAIKRANSALAAAFALEQGDTGYVPSDKTDYRPRLISNDELEQRRANQRRHQARGEGWGQS